MSQLALPAIAWEAMTDEEREVFCTQFPQVRLGIPAEDSTDPTWVVWDDGRLETFGEDAQI